MNCLISSFYIKPQHLGCWGGGGIYCLISSFYIKPQLTARWCLSSLDCLISSFYIKPQPAILTSRPSSIVLYRLSTSNHNTGVCVSSSTGLSYIVFLHQTTTIEQGAKVKYILSYIVFLHQTTTLLIYSPDLQSVLSYMK